MILWAFVIGLIAACFAASVYVGWREWRHEKQVTWEQYIRRLEKDCGIDWADSWFYDPDVWPIAPAPETYGHLPLPSAAKEQWLGGFAGQKYRVVERNGLRYHEYADGKRVAILTAKQRRVIRARYTRADGPLPNTHRNAGGITG